MAFVIPVVVLVVSGDFCTVYSGFHDPLCGFAGS